MKGFSLGIEVIVVLIVSVTVLTVLLLMFRQTSQPTLDIAKLEQQRAIKCGAYANIKPAGKCYKETFNQLSTTGRAVSPEGVTGGGGGTTVASDMIRKDDVPSSMLDGTQSDPGLRIICKSLDRSRAKCLSDFNDDCIKICCAGFCVP